MSQIKYPTLVSVIETGEHLIIPIYNNQFTIGRCTTNDYIIPVIQLSREHCKFMHDDVGNWVITDLSTFGTTVNGIKLSKGESHMLREGDLINFGPNKNEFHYRFTYSLEYSPPMKRARMDENGPSFVAAADNLSTVSIPSSSKTVQVMELTIQDMTFKLKSKEDECVAMTKAMEDKDEEHRRQVSDLLQQQEAEKQQMCEQHQSELSKKDAELREVLARELQTMENNIKNGFRDEENAKIKQLRDELERVKVELQNTADKEQMLLDELRNFTTDPEEVKQSVFVDIANLMENELQCSICNELFVEATTLNCRHTFCCYCICLWRTKKNDCPVCRSLIVSQNRILALDNFIVKMVELFAEDVREKRQELIAERTAVSVVGNHDTPTVRRAARRRNRSSGQTTSRNRRATSGLPVRRRGATTQRRPHIIVELTTEPPSGSQQSQQQQQQQQPSGVRGEGINNDGFNGLPPLVPVGLPHAVRDMVPPELIELGDVSSGERTIDNSSPTTDPETSSQSEFEYYDGSHHNSSHPLFAGGARARNIPYYGGYGYCFRCGDPGHWANGCPQRFRN